MLHLLRGVARISPREGRKFSWSSRRGADSESESVSESESESPGVVATSQAQKSESESTKAAPTPTPGRLHTAIRPAKAGQKYFFGEIFVKIDIF